MQKAANNIQVVLIILLMSLLFYGCGTGDALDELDNRYRLLVSFSDAEEDGVHTVDVDNQACDANGTTFETFTDLAADIGVTVAENAPGLTLTGYKITFTPILGYDRFNNPLFGPAVGPYLHDRTEWIPTESSLEFRIQAMEADVKLFIETQLPACSVAGDPCTDLIFIYDVSIRLDFRDEYGEPRDITWDDTLYFGRYDNC